MSAITMLHAPHGASVFIAVPAYQGLGAGTAFSLFEAAKEIDAELAILAQCCHVDDARNMLVRQFLDSKADDLVFIDSDLKWEPGALKRLLEHDGDIVCGSYPLKQYKLHFTLRWLPGPTSYEPGGLLEVEAAPTGFMRIRRHVLETLWDKATKFRARDDDLHDTGVIFERGFIKNARVGGDYHFCMKARQEGFRVWVDPEMYFEHGPQHGCLGAWIRKNAEVGLSFALSQLGGDGQTVIRACREIYRAWDNKWTLIPEALVAVTHLARKAHSILECGAGASSLVMAAANPNAEVHALENSPEWADRVRNEANRSGLINLTVHDAPLVDGPYGRWYRVPDLPKFDLVLCDGPAFHQGDGTIDHSARNPLPKYIDLSGAVLVLDDVHHQRALFESYSQRIESGKIGICIPERKAKAA